MGCHDTFTLWRLESITFKLLISSSVNCGRVVANQVCWSCRRIHENWQKCGCCLESGPVEASQPYWWLRPWLIRADKVCCCCTVQSCNLFIPDHSETGWWVSAGLSDSILSATISMDQQRGLPSQSSSQSGSARSKGAFQLFLTGVWPFVSRWWFCLTPLEFLGAVHVLISMVKVTEWYSYRFTCRFPCTTCQGPVHWCFSNIKRWV